MDISQLHDANAGYVLDKADELMDNVYPIRFTVEGKLGDVSGTIEYMLFGEWVEASQAAHCGDIEECIDLLIETGSPIIFG